ncbi:hypothetical protein M501DRAFT_913071, partial [Patellaria atrata CBS 101060]
MYSRNDPRLRRTLNQLSQNIESANESAQANLFTFSQHYISPCLSSIGNCFHSCTALCFPSREERLRRNRNRARSRGRAELSFDFYDDWEEEENDALLGWGSNEFDRLLSGPGGYGTTSQPSRQAGMTYVPHRGGRRLSGVQSRDGGPDPTIIPSSSYFGFLGKLPWKIGGKGLKYKPSAADLQEHPGAGRRSLDEQHPLIEESEEEEPSRLTVKHKRNRSETATSGHTTDSLSSRGDIFPSEDEIDDAIPLDDEFAMALERRGTVSYPPDEVSSGKSRSGKASSKSPAQDKVSDFGIESIPSLADIKQENERVQKEEEEQVEKKREAARKLAITCGLSTERPITPSSGSKT